MKFTELTEEKQKVEIHKYITGWLETHPDDQISIQDARQLCIDSEEDFDE